MRGRKTVVPLHVHVPYVCVCEGEGDERDRAWGAGMPCEEASRCVNLSSEDA